MNWLDALALINKLRERWGLYAHLKPGETKPVLIRTRIAGRMWRLKGDIGPEA